MLCTLSAIPLPLLGKQHVQSTFKKSIMSKSVPSLVKHCNKLNQLWWLKLSIYVSGSGATWISEIDSVIPICLFCGISGAQPIPYLTSWIRYVIHNISYDNNNKEIYLSIRDNFYDQNIFFRGIKWDGMQVLPLKEILHVLRINGMTNKPIFLNGCHTNSIFI